jgi:hypothetical protein
MRGRGLLLGVELSYDAGPVVTGAASAGCSATSPVSAPCGSPHRTSSPWTSWTRALDPRGGSGRSRPRGRGLTTSRAQVASRTSRPVGSEGLPSDRIAPSTTPSPKRWITDGPQAEILAHEALLDRDHWTVLGIKPGATAEAVKLAYFEASRVFHPDRYYGKNLGSYPRPAGAHLPAAERGARGAHRGLAPCPWPWHRRGRPGRERHWSHSTADRVPTSAGPAGPAPIPGDEGPGLHAGRRGAAPAPQRPDKALQLLDKAKALGGIAGRSAPRRWRPRPSSSWPASAPRTR